jgi:antitoxin (DNA-binding transcriptional repressor) of toxin-antitoxin stability system
VDRVAGKTRVVSARELSRRMSSILDEVESEGSALVVIRYGRPAAMLIPFRESAERPQLPRIADIGATSEVLETESEQLVLAELGDDHRCILLGIARCRYLHWTPGQSDLPASRLAIALSSLEIRRVIARGSGGSWTLTPVGERLARRLDSES